MNRALAVRGMSKSFGGVAALADVGLEIEDGSIVGIVGPNGAGKSTLVNVLTGFQRPDRGEVWLGSIAVTGMRPHQLAQLGIARTYQNLRLFEGLSVIENVLAGRHLAFNGRIWQLLATPRRERREQLARAEELVDLLGLSAEVETSVDDLPYGPRRRVEIARALAAEPHLLLLDEPTAGMTRVEATEIGHLIQRLRAEGLTIALVEHNIGLVSEICDDLVVLDTGHVIMRGTPEAVWADERVRTAYLGAGIDG